MAADTDAKKNGSGNFGEAGGKPHWGALFYPAKQARPGPDGIFGYLLYVPRGQAGPADFLAEEAQEVAPPVQREREDVVADVEQRASADEHETGVWWPVPGEPRREQHWKATARLAERRMDWVKGKKAEQEKDWEDRKKKIDEFARSPDPYGGLEGYITARVGRAQCWAQTALGRKAVENGAGNLAKLQALEEGLVRFLTDVGAADRIPSADGTGGQGRDDDPERQDGDAADGGDGPPAGAPDAAAVSDEDTGDHGGD